MSSNTYTARLIALLGVAATMVALAACGSSSSSTSSASSASSAATSASTASSSSGAAGSCQNQATALVNQYKAPSGWDSPGPAFSTSGIKGKTIYWISLNADIPFTQDVFAGFKEAASAAGVKYVFFNGAGSASTESRGIEEAISAHADLIMIQSFPVSQVSVAVKHANAAKIPVVEFADTNAGAPPDPGVQAEVSYNYTLAGSLMAADAIRISNCKVKGVTFTSYDEAVAPEGVSGIKTTLAKYCPSTCSTTVENALIADWSTRLPGLAQTAAENPSVNWMFPLYDGETLFVDPAIAQANAATRVKVASYNATKGIVNELAKSTSPLWVDVGSPLEWTGWAIADQSYRVLAKAQLSKDENIPLRIFDKDNIKSIDLSQPESSWYGGATDFKAEYMKLWGVS
jgi:ribose transport system substrate-binding protein